MSDFEEVMHPDIEEYAEKFSSKEPSILYELDRETHLKTINPRMISGHLQGHLLRLLCQLKHPKNILDIGTFTGYSSLCFALSTDDDTKITTIEGNPEVRDIALTYFEKAGLTHKITSVLADATTYIANCSDNFDVIYLDADKKNYPLYFDLLVPKLAIDGLFIADNVLWSGQVLHPSTNKEVIALQTFNQKMHDDPRMENLLLPLRDGLMIARKISN